MKCMTCGGKIGNIGVMMPTMKKEERVRCMKCAMNKCTMLDKTTRSSKRTKWKNKSEKQRFT